MLPDADIEATASAIVGAAFGSAGERCMALPVVVPVGEETADALAEAIARKARGLTVSHSLDPKADFGPLVCADALERVNRMVTDGVEAGAQLLVDGREWDFSDKEFDGESLAEGFYAGPSFFDRVTTDMDIYKICLLYTSPSPRDS